MQTETSIEKADPSEPAYKALIPEVKARPPREAAKLLPSNPSR